MSRLSFDQHLRVTAALVDGCSIRTVERLCSVHRDTVMRWGLRLGEACQRLHDALLCELHIDLLQVDEIWAFIYKKQKRLGPGAHPDHGDEYTYVGLDAVKKTIVAYCVGKRTAETTRGFACDLRRRIVNRPQISSDGYQPYIEAIELAFGCDVDYAMVVKQYGGTPSRYQGSQKIRVMGDPGFADISTSLIERENLTMRMSLRRFTRKTNAFSKKLRNHKAAVALYVAHYNFCRLHETLRITPAMASGVTDHVWSLGELIEAALSILAVELPDGQPVEAVRALPPHRDNLRLCGTTGPRYGQIDTSDTDEGVDTASEDLGHRGLT